MNFSISSRLLSNSVRRTLACSKKTIKKLISNRNSHKALSGSLSFSLLPLYLSKSSPETTTVLPSFNAQPTSLFESICLAFRKFFRAGVLIWRFLPLGLFYLFLPILPSGATRFWQNWLIRAMGNSGPCFIKLGQWIATRPDIFPEALTEPLSIFHTRAPAHSFVHTARALEEAYKPNVFDREIFSWISTVPLASGAVAQVHRATLVDGTQVVVKVKHPGVDRIVAMDFSLLISASRILSWVFSLDPLSLEESFRTFGSTMTNQLDMSSEARNLDRFRSNFKEFPRIVFPRPYLELSNRDVLVETYEEGETFSVYLGAKSKFLNEKQRCSLALLGASCFLKMMIVDNLVHSDLHPGNMLVRKGKDGQLQVVILDVGLVTVLSEHDHLNFLALFKAVVKGDGRAGGELMIKNSRAPNDPSPKDAEEFKEGLHKLLVEATKGSISQIQVGPVLSQILTLCRKHKVKIESNFASLVTGIAVVEGLARQLNCEFNLLDEARPLLLSKHPELVAAYIASRLEGISLNLAKSS